VLFMGRPGVGKTTAIRELSRLLADDLGRRVVIVDTSNEIGGDGDVPHAGIGRARRMQVCVSVCLFGAGVRRGAGVAALGAQPCALLVSGQLVACMGGA
jgi:stage III sporulation protein SpoIIIAA